MACQGWPAAQNRFCAFSTPPSLSSTGSRAPTVGTIINNPAEAIKIEMAAIEQHIPEFLSGPLYARFGARERQAQPLSHCFLRQPLVLRQQQRLAVFVWQAVYHRAHAGNQFAYRVVERVLGWQFWQEQRVWQGVCLPPDAVIIGDGIARDLINPALQPLLVPQRIDMQVDLQENVLQDILRVLLIRHAPENELLQSAVKTLPDCLCCCYHSYPCSQSFPCSCCHCVHHDSMIHHDGRETRKKDAGSRQRTIQAWARAGHSLLCRGDT